MMNELEHILSKRYKQEALFGLFQRYFVDWIADAYIAKDMNIFEISAINEKTDKEKRTSVTYLVQAHSVSGAVKHVDEVMGSTMIDYEIAAITETKVMDVFEHHAGKKNEKPEFEQ